MAKTDELMPQEPTAADRPTVPMPSNPTTAEGGLVQKNQALDAALDTVPADRLRGIIKNLCLISDSAEKHISQLLLTPEENDNPPSKRKHSAADENIEASNSSKRKKSHDSICAQCDSGFDIAQNHGKACRYHPGKREVDHVARVWDEQGWPEPDSGLEEEVPEGYEWTCCERPGYDRGCKRGPHRKDHKEADEESDEDAPSDTGWEDDEESNNSKDGDE